MDITPQGAVTLDNVEDFIGKTVDSKRRAWHYYPLTFKKFGENYFYVDRNGVMVQMDKHDAIHYDSVTDAPQKKPKDRGAR